MRTTFIKLAVFMVGLLFLGTAQALPISGEIQIGSAGNFIDSTGAVTNNSATATGFDFADNTLGGGRVGDYGQVPTGDIYDMIVNAGNSFPMDLTMSDFNLANIPPAALEWAIAPVKVASGASGVLNFKIDGGHVGDNDPSTPSSFDLAGTGYFEFVCTTNCGLQNSTTDTSDVTAGRWSISNSLGGTLVTLTNVPAPATIGILGIALLGLGMLRRRSAAA